MRIISILSRSSAANNLRHGKFRNHLDRPLLCASYRGPKITGSSRREAHHRTCIHTGFRETVRNYIKNPSFHMFMFTFCLFSQKCCNQNQCLSWRIHGGPILSGGFSTSPVSPSKLKESSAAGNNRKLSHGHGSGNEESDMEFNVQKKTTGWEIVRKMLSYVWPKDNNPMKARVAIAMALLLGSKVD